MFAFFIIGALMVGTVMWGAKYFTETGGPDLSDTHSSEIGNEVDDTKPSSTSNDPKPSSISTTTKPSILKDGIGQILFGSSQPEILEKPLKITTTKDRKPSSISTNTKPSDPNDDILYEGYYDFSHPEILGVPPKATTTNKKHKHTSGYVGNGWWSSGSYFGWEPDSYPGLSWASFPQPTQAGLNTIPPHNEEHTSPNTDNELLYVQDNSEESQGLNFIYNFFDHDKVAANPILEAVAVTVSEWLVPGPVHFNDSWGVDYDATAVYLIHE